MSDIHFPLALLAYGRGEDWANVRFNAIIAWSAESLGEAKLANGGVTEDWLESKVGQKVWSQVQSVPEKQHRRAVVWAASTTGGWRFTDYKAHAENLKAAQDFCNGRLREGGQSPFVRVPADFAAEAFEKSEKPGMNYREFSVLCAVYSCIGAKEVTIVRREQIRLRQTGAWNDKSMALLTRDAINPDDEKRPTPPKLLTIDQLRYTLDELEGRGLFYRLPSPNRRDMFFSRRLNPEAMALIVAGIIKKRAGKLDRTAAQAKLAAALAG